MNAADQYAHRGSVLQSTPLYVYRMYVRRELRGNRKAVPDGAVLGFEPRYLLARA